MSQAPFAPRLIPYIFFFPGRLDASKVRDAGSGIPRTRPQAQQRRVANSAPEGGNQQPGPGTSASSIKEKKEVGKRIVLLENRLDGVMVG